MHRFLRPTTRPTRSARAHVVWLRPLSLATLLACSAVLPAAAQEVDRAAKPALPGNVVYVESNDPAPGKNGVLAYRRDGAGRLTPLPGSPFLTGGAGFFDASFALGPFDSDQNVVVDRKRRLLFAVNGGSNTIAVFHILADGGLRAVEGSPFASRGVNPVGIGLRGDFLVVVNKDGDPAQGATQDRPGYDVLRIRADGSLIPVPGARVRLAEGVSPTQPLTTDTGSLVLSTEFPQAGLFDVMRLSATGSLRLLGTPAVPPPRGASTVQGPAPLGLWAHPKLPYLYAGLPATSQLGVFRWTQAGKLSFVRRVPTGGGAPCWVRVNREGTRIYVSDTASAAISVFDSSRPGAPVEIQTLRLAATGSIFQITLDDDERFLYVVGQRSTAAQPGSANSLHVAQIAAEGTLREVAGSPLALPVPVDSRPQGVAAL